MDKNYILEKEKISKAVLTISTPSAISTISSVVYNIINTIFIGRFVGFIGVAAISIYLPIQMLISSFIFLFASGTGSYISRQLGMKNLKNAEKAAGNLYACVLTLIFLIVTLGLTFTPSLVTFFGAKAAVVPLAITYARMMLLGAMFFPLNLASNNVMRAEGATDYSMKGVVISMISNFLLDILFIVIFKWGVFGAGLSTTISKFINFMYIVYYFKFKSTIKIKIINIKYNFSLLKEVLPIGFSTFINQSSGSIAIMLLNRDLYHFGGNLVVAIYGIVFKLTSIIQKSVAGFSRGTQPLIGFNFGANNLKRVTGSVKWGLIYSTTIGTIGTIILMIFSKEFIELFTNNIKVINNGTQVLRIALLASPLLGLYFLAISYFRATGKAKESIILSLLRRVFFFIPFLYLLPYTFNLGILGVWIVLPLSNAMSAILGGLFLSIDFKKYKL